MSPQNHNLIWLNQRLNELKTEYPENINEINSFKIFANNLVEFWKYNNVDLWVDSIDYINEKLNYVIKAQAQDGFENNPETLELLKRLANV